MYRHLYACAIRYIGPAEKSNLDGSGPRWLWLKED